MAKMTGGQALAKSLYREGVRVIFGLPGVQTYHAMDALAQEPGIQFITTRHEQAATYMADGFARAGGDPGIALVVPGPGLQNASAGLGTAYSASSPVFLISGQVPIDKIGKDVGVLHEVNDQLDTIKPITKWQARILNPADIPAAVHEGFRNLKTGRPRPVEIEIPPETLAEEAEVELYESEEYPRLLGDNNKIKEALNLLSKAKNPVIWAGGGVNSSGASDEIRGLAELLQAGVITTPEGKGSISDRHPLSLGAPRRTPDALSEYFQGCDVVLAVGTRFAEAPIIESQTIIQIDVDPSELGRNHPNTLGVLGDAQSVLQQMIQALSNDGYQAKSKQEFFENIREQRRAQAIITQPQGEFIRVIREVMPDDGILISGMTQVGYYSRWAYPVFEPRTYLTSSYYGNLGYAYPTALGAKIAQPDRAVVAVSGDGGFLFNSQELATAAMYNINAVVIVFNDNAFGNVYRDQINRFEGRAIGSQLKNPDFVKLAEAYGVEGFLAKDAEELKTVLSVALSRNNPTLIEVPVGMMPYPF